MKFPDKVLPASSEVWADIAGYEGLYQVSNLGRVKALERLVSNNGGAQHRQEQIIGRVDSRGYAVAVLCKDGQTKPMLIHRLVATAFIPNPEGKQFVDHIDTNRANNAVSNLRWATAKENCNNPLSRKHSSEAKQGHPYWGKPLSDEAKAKISRAHKGRKLTDEQKAKLSEAHMGQLAWNKGITGYTAAPRGEAFRKAQSERLKGNHKGMTWIVVDGKRVWIEKEKQDVNERLIV